MLKNSMNEYLQIIDSKQDNNLIIIANNESPDIIDRSVIPMINPYNNKLDYYYATILSYNFMHNVHCMVQ